MRFFIVDDDEAIRFILNQIIEDEDLGEVVGESADGDQLTGSFLNLKKVDILFLDLLMPIQDGIETIQHIRGTFQGKIIMLSQVESKTLIGEAYALGIEYYVMKPINRIEMVTVIRKVIERLQLEKSIQEIKTSLSSLLSLENGALQPAVAPKKEIMKIGEFLLSELGIFGHGGTKDLLDILEWQLLHEQEMSSEQNFPSLKELFTNVAQKRLGPAASEKEINREIKSSEQRIRRAIIHSLTHFAALGLEDYSNQTFETYASRFFDFVAVRQKMLELQENSSVSLLPIKINMKKFIQVFCFEAKRLQADASN